MECEAHFPNGLANADLYPSILYVLKVNHYLRFNCGFLHVEFDAVRATVHLLPFLCLRILAFRILTAVFQFLADIGVKENTGKPRKAIANAVLDVIITKKYNESGKYC